MFLCGFPCRPARGAITRLLARVQSHLRARRGPHVTCYAMFPLSPKICPLMQQYITTRIPIKYAFARIQGTIMCGGGYTQEISLSRFLWSCPRMSNQRYLHTLCRRIQSRSRGLGRRILILSFCWGSLKGGFLTGIFFPRVWRRQMHSGRVSACPRTTVLPASASVALSASCSPHRVFIICFLQ